MIVLSEKIEFPALETADADGLLAIGGDLSPERLILAYQNGIFPWYNEGQPIIWFAPPERMVLFFDDLKISKSMKKTIQKNIFRVTFNQRFEQVVQHCKSVPRIGQNGTWITDEMQKAYSRLHKMGIAKSVEVWKEEKLVGGLYGIDLGHIFTGESMFSLVSDASKFAFIALVEYLKTRSYLLLDCQVYNPHLESLGATEISRKEFMRFLKTQDFNPEN